MLNIEQFVNKLNTLDFKNMYENDFFSYLGKNR
jgi:hypothetical protein